MSRILETWRSWSVRRRLVVAGGAVLLLALGGGLIAYLALKRPGDVSNPDAVFVPQEKPELKTTHWPVYGYNEERTRYLPTKRVKPPFGKDIWKFDAGRLLEFSPILVGDRLYLLDKAAVLYSLRARTGTVDWKRDIGALNASAPAFLRGGCKPPARACLFASTLEPGEVVSVNARNGKLLWNHPLPGRTETSPLVYRDKVLVGCECGDILALDAKTGRTEWTVPSDGPVKGGVALHEGIAYIGNYAGQFFAIDASSGDVKWQAESQGLSFGRAGRFYSTPAVAFGRVYAGNIDGRIYSFVAETGELAWSQSTGGYVYAGPAVADAPGTPPTVYIGSVDQRFRALDAKTGAVRWERHVGGPVLGAASVVGDVVYVGVIGDNRGTYGFDVKSGKQVFESPLGEYNPVISDSHWIYLTGASKLVAMRPKREEPKKGEDRQERRTAKGSKG
jgi:outer membrane protein assembly factor BamB